MTALRRALLTGASALALCAALPQPAHSFTTTANRLMSVQTAGYTGPGDYATYAAYWALRGYSKAVAATGTQKAMQVRRVSDDATQDILILPNGRLDVASLQSFLGGTADDLGTAAKVYDQTGNSRDLVQATTSLQPRIRYNAPNGGVSLYFLGSAHFNMAAAIPDTALPYSVSAVVKADGTGSWDGWTANGAIGLVDVNAGPLVKFPIDQIPNVAGLYTGAWVRLGLAQLGKWHAINASSHSGSETLDIDGVAYTAAVGGTQSTGTSYNIGGVAAQASHFTGNFLEGGIAFSEFSAGTRNAVRANQISANSIPFSCAKNYVFVGDSQALGNGAGAGKSFPVLFGAGRPTACIFIVAYNGDGWDYKYTGLSDTMWNLNTSAVNEVSPLLALLPAASTYVVGLSWGNDWVLNGSTGAATYAFVPTWVTNVTAGGFPASHIYIGTAGPRQSGGSVPGCSSAGTYEGCRTDYNSALVAGAAGLGVNLIRVDLDANIGAAGAQTNAACFQAGDLLHFTGTGSCGSSSNGGAGVMTQLVQAVLP